MAGDPLYDLMDQIMSLSDEEFEEMMEREENADR